MATVIEYYVPERFRKQSEKWTPAKQGRKVIPFPVLEEKSVLRRLRLGWPLVSLSNEYVAFRSIF
jgi:hypothetical protein